MTVKSEKILLAHGSGGKLSHELLRSVILKELPNRILEKLTDSAEIEIETGRIAFTTDSYTVKPIFFPGGDIGKLSIYGTVNDLSAVGARPRYLSLGVIIEEGLESLVLGEIVRSIGEAARKAKVWVVAGDTKVVEKGSGDKIFINTSGIGELAEGVSFSPDRIEEGDKILISGTIGDHGAAVLCHRQGLGFSGLESDCAPLWSLVEKLIEARCNVKFMRDPTRGGLATVLNEIAAGRNFGIKILEWAVPVKEQVKAFCEVLGLDPFYIANEGKMVMAVSPRDAGRALEVMRSHPLGREAGIIGEVVPRPKGKVFLITSVKGSRILDMLVGEQFPRIC